MLRGNCTAHIDDKGRLKIPTYFRRKIEEKYGTEVFITSLNGENVKVYPVSEWEIIEQRLALLPTMDSTRQKFLDRANYYGQPAEIDAQGRILIQPLLREKAKMAGEVVVLGNLNYLEVWEHERFQIQRLTENIFSAEDEAVLARLGI